MKKGYFVYLFRGITTMILSVLICYFVFKINNEFISIIPLAAWGLLELLIFIYKNKQNNDALEKGIILLSTEEKQRKKAELEEKYNIAKQAALETPEQRYDIDRARASILSDIAAKKKLAWDTKIRGMRMSSSTPKSDWATAGGLAEGLAGPAAGLAAAYDTMRKNAEATERQHEEGRQIEDRASLALEICEAYEKEIKATVFEKYTYSQISSQLIDELKVELDSSENYDVGYISAKIKISASRNHIFPGNNKKAVIDGSVRVDLYDKDGTKLMASGYYCAPGRCINDRKATGFGLMDKFEIISLKEEPGVSFNKNNGFQIKLSNPNLWLLEL